MEQPDVRYATTSDGVSIAYWTMGQGRPLFVSSPLTFAHAGLEPRIPAIAAFYERIANDAMLVRWDQRNYGMSQRGVEYQGIEDWARDVTAVAEPPPRRVRFPCHQLRPSCGGAGCSAALPDTTSRIAGCGTCAAR